MSSLQYMREYHRRQYTERVEEMKKQLGGACTACGSKDKLEIDHKDPKKKRGPVTQMTARKAMREEELAKCQLLCKPCHTRKSILERGQTPARGTHGTVSAARYCGPPRCEACRAAVRKARK